MSYREDLEYEFNARYDDHTERFAATFADAKLALDDEGEEPAAEEVAAYAAELAKAAHLAAGICDDDDAPF
jgi:hypothetical protein